MEIAIEFVMEMDHRPTILPELVKIFYGKTWALPRI